MQHVNTYMQGYFQAIQISWNKNIYIDKRHMILSQGHVSNIDYFRYIHVKYKISEYALNILESCITYITR